MVPVKQMSAGSTGMVGGSTLSVEQRRVLENQATALLVLGGPGTGKTSTLVAGAAAELHDRAWLAPAPLVIAHSRRSASELRNAVTRASGGRAVRPQVMTFHGLARSLLLRSVLPERPPTLLTAPEQEFRVRELLAGSRGWPASLEQALPTRGMARQVRTALARARQLGLDPDDVAAMGASAGRPDWERLGGFFEEYLTVLDAEGSIDYAEIVHRARIELTQPALRDALTSEISSIWVDDYAEIDPAQLGLLIELAGIVPRVRAFADPDTVAFGFRGVHRRAVAEFSALFARGVGASEVVVLREGHRLPAVVGDAVGHVLARLPLRVPLGVGAVLREVRVDREGGDVVARVHDSQASELAHLAADLRALHVRHGVPWSDMAVICRSPRTQFPELVRVLADHAVPVAVSGDDLPLAQQPAVRVLLLALSVALAGHMTADEARLMVTSPLCGLDAVRVRALQRAVRTQDRTPAFSVVAAGLLDPDQWPDAQVPEPVRRLGTLLCDARDALADGASVDAVLWGLWQGTAWPKRLRDQAVRHPMESADRDLDALCALFELAGSIDRVPGARGARAFLAEVTAQEIPADTEREARLRRAGVRLTSVHRTKGEGWPVVFVPGVQEGVWPDTRTPPGLIDAGALTTHGLDGLDTPAERMADERRLFALACSRSSGVLVVSASEGTEGEASQPSRFLDELVPGGVELVRGHPPVLASWAFLTAALRRAAIDPGSSEALRQAAASRLRRLTELRDRDGQPVAPDADPTRWWGVLEPTPGPPAASAEPGLPVRLTASQVASVLSCPRQYWLGREVTPGMSRSAAASLGSVIHALAQHVSADGLSLQDALDELEGVWERVPFEATWLSGAERLQAEAALARLIRWQDGRDGHLLGVEVPFDVTIDVTGRPVRLVGSVDRLEVDGLGRLRIVDFKTGRSVPTRAEGAEHPQMGLYQVAAAAGAFSSLHAGLEVAGGELVFLRAAASDDAPTVLFQASLAERPHLDDADAAYPTWMHHRLALVRDTLAAGIHPAQPGPACRWCPFASSCPAQVSGRQVIV